MSRHSRVRGNDGVNEAVVIPSKEGIHNVAGKMRQMHKIASVGLWIPAFAGMTGVTWQRNGVSRNTNHAAGKPLRGKIWRDDEEGLGDKKAS